MKSGIPRAAYTAAPGSRAGRCNPPEEHTQGGLHPYDRGVCARVETEVETMPRPIKGRNVCCLPRNARFGPLGQHAGKQAGVTMTVDEFETIRLIDYLNFTQEECAREMNVARTTVQGIYDQARRKVAYALVDSVPLTISGGEYRLYGGSWDDEACHRGACNRHRHGQGMRALDGSPSQGQEEEHEDSRSG